MSQQGIPESEWKWRGMPGHLIVSTSCCFHLVTEIGPHRISTIGCYHSGAVRTYDSREEIGLGRLYETMVFRLDPDGEVSDWAELDSDGYNEEAEAEKGHLAMCRKWAKLHATFVPHASEAVRETPANGGVA